MKKVTQMILAAIIFFVSACNEKKLAKTELSKKETLSITLNLSHLKTPLSLRSNQGALFFETNEGPTWINQLPDEEQNTPLSYMATWKLESREVNFSVVSSEKGYELSITANPDIDILKWGFGLSASENEFFTGLFERTIDGNQTESWKQGIETAMNLRGESVDMFIKPTLSLYTPFYLSSNNYGLLVNGTWPGYYDFCKADPGLVQIEFEGPSFSALLYTAPDPATIVKKHSLNAGPALIPPKWAFMPWRWRDNHNHLAQYYDGTPVKSPYNSQLVEDILMMQAYDIPCGVYWVDRPWAKGSHGYADFEWDPDRFPKAGDMISWLHQRDVKFLLWIAPWVTGNMKEEANRMGYSIPMKGAHAGIDSSTVALLDFTNGATRAWWQTKGIEKMLKQGVDGFKLDRSEEVVPETRDVLFADGRTAREVRNAYPVLYAKTVFESCARINGEDFVMLTRAGYTGSARYTSFWGGDIGSPQEGLRAAIVALLRSSIIGFPIWGSDIGGYWQGDLDREVFARWLAFGCFNPLMEVGPTEDLAPWSMNSEPYYDEELIAIWRMYAKIHASLVDYSYNNALTAKETGMPVVRPLFLNYPDQPESWKNWQTFLYGDDILVSAIWEKNTSTHRFYLPKGDRWVNAWNPQDVFEGGQWIEMETPLNKIPILVRENGNVNLGDLEQLYQESLQLAKNKPDLSKLEAEAFGE